MIKKSIYFLVILLTASFTLFAQFGKNIVQYQDFKWKYIESKHFNIYYNEGSKELAEFTAIAAEDALGSIQKTLNYRLSKRVSIIVYDSHNEFQQTNVVNQFMYEGIGGVTESLKNRIVLPFQGNYAQLKHVTHHELTHAIVNDMFFGGTFQTAVSTGNMTELPLWINEGFAEYESLGGLDVPTDMFIRDLAQSENILDLRQMNGYYAYRGGQSVFCFIEDKYGKDKVTEFINKLRYMPSLDAAFKAAFHMSTEEFSDAYRKEMKRIYWPDINRFKDPDDFAQKVTDHKKDYNYYNTSPAISPDGEKMAYISDKSGLFSIYIRGLGKKDEPVELISSFRKQDFEDLNFLTPGISWSPNGKQLAISAKAGGEDAIFIVNAQNSDYTKLKFSLRSISSVTWSPDGKKLAFIASVHQQSDIYIYNFDTRKADNLTNDIFSDSHPVWDSKSSTIYFVSDRGDYTSKGAVPANFKIWRHDINQTDIFSINIKSKEIKRLTNSPDFEKTSLAVNTESGKLLYVSDDNGIGNIYELNLNTLKTRPLTNSLNGISQLSLASDASKVLFSSQVNGGVDIYILKNPFDLHLAGDTLTYTNLRESQLRKMNALREISKPADTTSAPVEKLAYGNFSIDPANQQVVKPNTEVDQKVKFENIKNSAEEYDDNDFIEKDYKINFSTDVIMGNPGFSTFWGFQGVTQMMFSDVMGDHKIIVLANLLVDLRNSTFYGIYQYLPDIVDYTFSIFHSAGYILGSDYNYYRFRNYGIGGNASYPLDLFNRFQGGLSLINPSKEVVGSDTSTVLPPNISRTLFVTEGAFVHDDVLWGYTAPVKGTRLNAGFKAVPKIGSNGIGFFTVSTDIRHYQPLFDYLTLAVRGTAAISTGANAQKFYLGGTDNWFNPTYGGGYIPFDKPEDFAFIYDQFKTPLRGFAINETSGNKFFLANIELRFPLFRALLPGPVPIVIQNIMGSVFLDVGGAWNGSLSGFKAAEIDIFGTKRNKDLFSSTGVGIRSNLLGLPMKLDIAWAYRYFRWDQPYYMFSLGYDF